MISIIIIINFEALYIYIHKQTHTQPHMIKYEQTFINNKPVMTQNAFIKLKINV